MSNSKQNADVIKVMRNISKKQAAVHSQIASASNSYDGTGTVEISAYLVAGSFTGIFNFNGVTFTCKAKFPFVGWATGTVSGTISLLVPPQSLLGTDDNFTFTCSTTNMTITFYQDGVSVGTFSGGDGISGGGAAAGACDWTNG